MSLPARRAAADESRWPGAGAALLEANFRVTGRFYRSPAGYLCRDELLIVRSGTPAIEPDAVFVMMNPGSSQPLDGADRSGWRAAVHAPARPDRTQHQVMRVMAHQGWDCVRVINLSDLRSPRSDALARLIAAYERQEGHDGHSIFSARRRAQLRQALQRRAGAPVVAAWGVASTLRPIAERALQALRECDVLGVPGRAGAAWRFRHPLPRTAGAQCAWVHDLAALLRDLPPPRERLALTSAAASVTNHE